ncbi:MAG: vWA domain-containing protein [Clostridia bacterium]
MNLDTIIDFVDEHRGVFIGVIIFLVLLIIGLIIFSIMYNPVKIVWENDDAKVIATRPTRLDIKAYATDKKKNKYDVKWEVNGGALNKDDGTEISWQLPEDEGTYSLIAHVGDKKIVKNVTVIKNELVNYLIQNQEKVTSKDTDMDGLPDEYEKNITKTEPLNIDSDSDELNDGDEILLSLDPLKSDSKGDGVKDSLRKLSYSFEDKEAGASYTVQGNGNITKTTIDKYANDALYTLPEVVSDVYLYYSKGNVESAKINIKYNKELVASKGIAENNLSIYRLIEDTNKFEKIGSTVNTQSLQVSADVQKLGKFFLADSTKIKDGLSTEVMLVIDNSGSMYSSEEITESKGNDPNFKRVDMSNNLINKLQGNYKFGASKFTYEYTNLSPLTDNKEQVIQKINTIKTQRERFTGTYIGAALEGGANQFANEVTSDRRFLILITDGKDSGGKDFDNKKLENSIKLASDKHIRVFTVGIGKEVDKKVMGTIADKTNGKFYYASTSESLQNIFELIAAEMNYNLMDVNQDSVEDSVLLKNTGFLPSKDGFSFENFASKQSKQGATYGLSLMAKLTYENAFPGKLGDMTLKLDNNETVKADGYSTGNIIKNGQNLCDFDFYKDTFITRDTKDIRQGTVSSGVVPFKTDVKNMINELGFISYNQKYNGNKKKAGFSAYENYYVDTQSEKFLDSKDAQFIKAMYRMEILKFKDESYNFTTNSDIAYSKMLESMAARKPVLLKLNNGYTVVGTRYSFDKENPNKAKIEIYDSNYKNQIRYIDVERESVNMQKDEDKSKYGKYSYKFRYNNNDIDVTLSLPNVETTL